MWPRPGTCHALASAAKPLIPQQDLGPIRAGVTHDHRRAGPAGGAVGGVQIPGDQDRDLDLADGSVVQWRPFNGKSSIVIDPARSFGNEIEGCCFNKRPVG